MDTITVTVINAHHPAYRDVWELREQVLRVPLGMSLKNENLSMDFEDIIVTAHDGERLIGCIMLHPLHGGVIKFRQMAVDPEWQGRKVGRQLLSAAEDESRKRGFREVQLHAREVAAGFYGKAGYSTVGGRFEEVGIPHWLMTKVL